MNKVVALPRLRQLADGWKVCARELVQRLVIQRSSDAVTELAEAFPLRVFPDTLGLPQEGREHLIPYAHSTFNAFGPRKDIF